MKWIFILGFSLVYSTAFSQDTLYSVRFPDGIISDSFYLKRKKYHIYPIENPTRRTTIPKKLLSKIHHSNGDIFVNKKYKPKDLFFLSTNPLNGNIEYKTELSLSKEKLDLRLNLVDSLNSREIEFHSLYRTEDSAIYQGRFKTKFAGDTHLTYFRLSLTRFNDKLTVRVSNLKSCHTDSIIYNWKVMDTIDSKKFVFDISRVYSLGRRFEDTNTYWNPINYYLSKTIWTVKKYFSPQQIIETFPITESRLSVFRNILYIDGLSGYSNYFDKRELNYPEKATKNLISIGFQFGAKWNFGSNQNYKFGLNLHVIGIEMFIGDIDPGFSINAGEIGPSFTKKINPKSSIELSTTLGFSTYLRISSGYIGPTIESNPNLKSSFEFKYHFQKFIIGTQINNRYPLNMNSVSLLIGYCIK